MSATFSLSAVTVDCRDVDAVAGFWAAVFGVEIRESLPGWRRIGPLSSGGPVLTFQPVPEPKHGKARLHLDVQVADLAAAIATVLQLGGSDLGEVHVYDEGTVVVMADIEGNEFCLVWRKDGAST